MNTRTHTSSALLSLAICIIAAIGPRLAHADFGISAQPLRSTQLSRSLKGANIAEPERELTSREIRRETILQTSLHASFIMVSTQLGADVDYFLNEQTSVGLSSNLKMEVFMDSEATSKNYSVHLKRFIGNSFYIKPSVGVHTFKSASFNVRGTRSGLGAQIELGNEWFFSEHFGMNLSYGALGLMYDGETEDVHMTNLIPSVRFFGAF